jgi:sulfur relay (sulfurtransferase) complex TusBCD TusD component (DsrE family)
MLASALFPHLCTKEEITMTHWTSVLFALAVMFGGAVTPAVAADADPLFVNLTSDEGHRVNMALDFGTKQMGRGHPLTVFLNDRAVHVASKANAAKFPEQQQKIEELIGKKAAVIACPFCMKHYGVQEGDLLPGIQVGNPELTGKALFKDGTKTMSW